MKWFHNIGKLSPFLICLTVFQIGFLYLAESAPSYHHSYSHSATVQQAPSSPASHNNASHLLGLFELEEEDDRLEDYDFLPEEHPYEDAIESLSTHLIILFAEERIQSISAPPIFLIDEQFRL